MVFERGLLWLSICVLVSGSAFGGQSDDEKQSLKACAAMVLKGFRKIADTREVRFQGKVAEATAICRGGQQALLMRNTPWVDWSHYFGTGDITSSPHGLITKVVLLFGACQAPCWILSTSASSCLSSTYSITVALTKNM